MLGTIVYPYCQKVLPLTYDDSLSYYEEIRKLIDKINEVISTFNEYESIIQQLAGLSADITGMQSDIATLKSEMLTAQQELADYSTAIYNLNVRDNDLQGQIDNLTTRVNSIVTNVNNIYNYVDNAVASVKVENSTAYLRLIQDVNIAIRKMQVEIDKMQALINELPHDVWNPVRGYRVGFDTNNRMIYGDLRYDGVTNAELSEQNLTNEQVASLMLNNLDYALNAKKRFKMHYLYSPVSGVKKAHANAISELFGVLTNGLTNEQFANLDMTNDEVVALDLTNIEKFLYYDGDVGLTNDENSRLFVNNIAGLVGLGKE